MNQLRQPDKPISLIYLLRNNMVAVEKESTFSLVQMERYEAEVVLLKRRKNNTYYKNEQL